MPTPLRIAFIIACCFAAGLAFYATEKHPYNFYIFTRWVVFLTCCWGLCFYRDLFWRWLVFAYIAIGVIFNPILPFRFQRSTWHNLDIAAGIILLALLAFYRKHNNSKSC